jgi:hypothetical protein
VPPTESSIGSSSVLESSKRIAAGMLGCPRNSLDAFNAQLMLDTKEPLRDPGI